MPTQPMGALKNLLDLADSARETKSQIMPCSCGAFSLSGLVGLNATSLEYSHQEMSFKRTRQLGIPASVDVV